MTNADGQMRKIDLLPNYFQRCLLITLSFQKLNVIGDNRAGEFFSNLSNSSEVSLSMGGYSSGHINNRFEVVSALKDLSTLRIILSYYRLSEKTSTAGYRPPQGSPYQPVLSQIIKIK